MTWKQHLQLYGFELPGLLGKAFNGRRAQPLRLLDLGCGEGNKLVALQRNGLLNKDDTIVGVDISAHRIATLERMVPGTRGIIGDACHVEELADSGFDIIICSEVIQYVPDDTQLIREIQRLLADNGIAVITTVLKKWYGFWFYRKDGSFWLDKHFLREYASLEEFLFLFSSNGLQVVEYRVTPLRYPILDRIVRTGVKLNLIEADNARHIYLRNAWLKALRRLKVPAVGYHSIEVLARKQQ